MTNFYLIRHAHTDLNGKMLFQGGLSDSKLDNIGIKQIDDSSLTVNKLLPKHYLLVCSPLTRTRQTAKMLNLNFANVVYDERIREIEFGDWEGRSLDSVKQEFPEEVNKYYNDDPDLVTPNGESISMVATRMKEAIKYYSGRKYADVVFVTHGNSISIGLSSVLMGNHPFRRIIGIPKNVSVSKLSIDEDHTSLEYFNRICY